jgi:2-iminobutanoate/2-iminopropanoate deaminase
MGNVDNRRDPGFKCRRSTVASLLITESTAGANFEHWSTTMDIEAITNDQMPRPLGPYSQAVQAGDLVFIAGQSGIDPATGSVPSDGFEAEARMAFMNLQRVLRAAGLEMDRVVKTTVFLSSADAFPAMNELYGEFFLSSPPVRSTPIVQLPRNLRISIEAIAAR